MYVETVLTEGFISLSLKEEFFLREQRITFAKNDLNYFQNYTFYGHIDIYKKTDMTILA